MTEMKNELTIPGEKEISTDDIINIAKGKTRVRLNGDSSFKTRMEKSFAHLMNAFEKGTPVYGVNTGYGKSCGNRMSAEVAKKNGENLLRFHGCGTGTPLGIAEVRAAMVCRLICLSKGFSGVSIELLEKIIEFLNNDITPVVPEEGSVGASGDLTPMSYIAACLAGEREVYYKGHRVAAMEALEESGIAPYKFQIKEPLSMINGTSVMTGIAVIAIDRARKILDSALCSTALCIHALKGNSHHFHPILNQVKPFPGQIYAANVLRNLLYMSQKSSDLETDSPETLQDPYSLRCAPNIIGVLHDTLDWVTRWVAIEANSSNDNPIFDPATGEPLMGGNFYGGHIALAMDSLKAALASVADMTDRQMALLVDPHLNRGLPADLVGVKTKERFSHHGFKAMSISTSALAAEALKLTMPAASFSRSTESNNQDKVSMGTIAARDALRICTLAERVIAIHLIAAAQACDLRNTISSRPGLAEIHKKIRDCAAFIVEDRPMDCDIEKIVQSISENIFSVETHVNEN